MDLFEAETIRTAVQWTARLSALTFAGFLGTGGLAALWPDSPLRLSAWRRRFLGGFISVHSIHFAAVLTLAAITGGANIMERGGWVLHIGVAFLFYGAVLKLWQEEQRRGEALSAGTRRFRLLAVSLLWLVFVQAYAFRVSLSWLFGMMAVLLTVTLALYLLPLYLRSGKR